MIGREVARMLPDPDERSRQDAGRRMRHATQGELEILRQRPSQGYDPAPDTQKKVLAHDDGRREYGVVPDDPLEERRIDHESIRANLPPGKVPVSCRHLVKLGGA